MEHVNVALEVPRSYTEIVAIEFSLRLVEINF